MIILNLVSFIRQLNNKYKRMKKLVIILIAMSAVINLYSQKVENYSEFMVIIKQNNPSLKALELTLNAQRESNRIGNTPSDLTVGVNPDFKGEGIDYSIGMDFLFPTIYYQTKRLAKMTTRKNESEYYVAMFQELQNIDKSYITAVYANKKSKLLQEAYSGNEAIKSLFKKQVDEGKTSILELNTAKGELLRSLSAMSETKLEYNNIHAVLYALNGGTPINVVTLDYPNYNIGGLDTFIERAMERSYDIQITNADSTIVAQNLKLAKHSWAPSISVSYGYKVKIDRSDTNYGDISVGLSIPIWANSHKIGAAKLEYSAMMENNRKVRLDVITKLEQLKNSYIMALESHLLHDEFISTSSNVELLRKSLVEGKLSAIDYYVEINRILEIELQKLEYEYRVVTTMAEMQSLLY